MKKHHGLIVAIVAMVGVAIDVGIMVLVYLYYDIEGCQVSNSSEITFDNSVAVVTTKSPAFTT